MLDITHHDVFISGLPDKFEGFRIVQWTDIHGGFGTSPMRIRRLAGVVMDQNPDVIVLTGDFISRSRQRVETSISAMKDLNAKDGVYAVLGNHDYWTDAESVTTALLDDGFDVLFNESRRIKRGDQSISLLGFDDDWEGNTDYVKAFDLLPDDGIRMAIAHNPDTLLSLGGNRLDFMMTGHTHGGLINLPFVGPLFSVTRLGRKYSSGMFIIGDSQLYICRGTGFGLRIRCKPEIAVFRLKRKV
ncbi:MAG: metallophosphoesterase [Armatimonadota bacterium]